jgi:hypothetical protein
VNWGRSTLWKHTNNTDVAFQVLKSYYVREKDLWKLTVMWFNIGRCHEPWYMGINERVEIPGSRRGEWKRYEYPGRQDPQIDLGEWRPPSE